MCIIIHQETQESHSNEGNENENRVEEIPRNKMPLYSEIKGEDIEEPKEEIVETSTSSEIDKVREPLSLSSLHKMENLYRPPILSI